MMTLAEEARTVAHVMREAHKPVLFTDEHLVVGSARRVNVNWIRSQTLAAVKLTRAQSGREDFRHP
jgi:hypothetical protein